MPISPSFVRATTMLACPDQTCSSAETTVTVRSAMALAVLLLDLRPLLLDVRDRADVEERLLGHVVEVAADDRVERLDRVLQRHRGALDTGELRRHVGVLGEELLDPPRPVDGDLVLLGQLV